MQVKVSQAKEMITVCFKAGLVPFLQGSPGIAKSAICRQIAEQFRLFVIDKRLSQCDPTDLSGFPNIAGNKAGYVPMEDFPVEGDPIPEGYDGWLLLLDEFNSAVSPTMQAAAYKLILDRLVGNKPLHKRVMIACTGNLETDSALVETMSTAMQSRLIHMELVVDSAEWIKWAQENSIDYRITSYIEFKPQSLYTFSPDHSDNTYGCPRTWEFANRILKQTEEESPIRLPLLAGTISEGLAREFLNFCKIHRDLPKIPTIVAAPDTIPVPGELSILYAISGAIGQNATMENLGALAKFVDRMPAEFQVITLKETLRRNKALVKHPAIHKWTAKFSDTFI